MKGNATEKWLPNFEMMMGNGNCFRAREGVVRILIFARIEAHPIVEAFMTACGPCVKYRPPSFVMSFDCTEYMSFVKLALRRINAVTVGALFFRKQNVRLLSVYFLLCFEWCRSVPA